MRAQKTAACFLLYDESCHRATNVVPQASVTATTTIILVIALVSTAFRYHRMSSASRIAHDDYVCFSALGLSLVPYLLLNMLVLRESVLLHSLSLTVLIRFAWLSFHTASLWGGRLSVALSIIRFLTPRGPAGQFSARSPFRAMAIGVACLFVLVGASLIAHKALVCGLNFTNTPSSCVIPSEVGYVEVTFDVLGDTWLIVAPIILVRNTCLAKEHRHLVIGIFSCAVFTGVSSIVRAVYIARKDVQVLIMLTSFVQAELSIINSNMAVTISFAYRMLQKRFSQKSHADSDTWDSATLSHFAWSSISESSDESLHTQSSSSTSDSSHNEHLSSPRDDTDSPSTTCLTRVTTFPITTKPVPQMLITKCATASESIKPGS